MRVLAIIGALAFMPMSVFADSMSKKYYEAQNVKDARSKLIRQKKIEAQIDLSQFHVNAMGAWRNDLKVPTTSNQGIEILPYRVTKSPS